MKKIALMLPNGYHGGTLRAVKNIAKSILQYSQSKGNDIQVVFSFVQDNPHHYDIDSDFGDLIENGISLRETKWEVYKKGDLAPLNNLLGINPLDLIYSKYCIPEDGANNFYDCDYWLIISDRMPAPLYPIKKYSCIIYDYIQRYVPEIFQELEDAWLIQESSYFALPRNAETVLVTTPATLNDIVSYVGVPKEKVILCDYFFSPPEINPLASNLHKSFEDYFIWPTNTTQHKNHKRLFQALKYYYEDLGGGLDTVITGYNTQYWDPGFLGDSSFVNAIPYIKDIKEEVEKSTVIKDKVHFMGNVNDETYYNLISNAKFLIHPNLYDNGTYTVLEAAYLGTPSLAAKYPAMEYINQLCGLNLMFFDPYKPREISKSILRMEKEYQNLLLPTNVDLERHSWKSNANTFYQIIRNIPELKS